MGAQKNILAINAGSSSVKYALVSSAVPSQKLLSGSVDIAGAGQKIVDELRAKGFVDSVAAVGHRIVNGGSQCSAHALVDDAMLKMLHEHESFDPDHLPQELGFIEELRVLFGGVPHVACFDTVFFAELPRVAQILPIPRRYEARGVRRYGFHGLSYTYLMKEVARILGDDAAKGNIVLAHLGHGASLAAVKGGKPIDTTMAFTPQSGIPMSARSGDLDPGIAWYLARTEGMDAKRFNETVSRESGLLGVSETTGAMLELLEKETSDPRAAEAIALFCYRVKQQIGAYAAALGGLDTLVFAGGIGEKAPKIRACVCDGLQFLGVELDAGKNDANEELLSAASGKVKILRVYTDEESVIAQETKRVANV